VVQTFYSTTASNKLLSQIDPSKPTGLEPAPKDKQYDVPLQMQKPLIPENRHNDNDIGNVYNPDKYQNNLGNYAQGNVTKPVESQIKNLAKVSEAKTAVKSG